MSSGGGHGKMQTPGALRHTQNNSALKLADPVEEDVGKVESSGPN